MSKTLAAVAAAGAALATAGGAVAENWYAFYIVPSGIAYVDKDSLVFRAFNRPSPGRSGY